MKPFDTFVTRNYSLFKQANLDLFLKTGLLSQGVYDKAQAFFAESAAQASASAIAAQSASAEAASSASASSAYAQSQSSDVQSSQSENSFSSNNPQSV